MIDIQNISGYGLQNPSNDILSSGYGLQDPGFELLRQVAQKYCPEELQAERRSVVPDEALNLSALSAAFSPSAHAFDGLGRQLHRADAYDATSPTPSGSGSGVSHPSLR